MKLALGAFILCACGSANGNDGPAAIDGVPAPDAAAATGPVTVTVRNADGSPTVGAPVATQLVNGEVLMVASTGTDGMAILQTVAGGSVTVGFDEVSGPRLVTIMGLGFGQSVLFQARPHQLRSTVPAVMLPPASPPIGTVAYLAQVPCRFGGQTASIPVGTTIVMPVTPDCIVDDTYSAAITALGAQDAALAYSFVEGITRGAGPSFPPWMTDGTSFSLAITHAPPCTECARLDTYRRTAKNLRYSAGGTKLSFPVGPDLVLSIFHAPSLPAPETGVVLTIDLGFAKAIVRRSTTAPPAADSIDLSQLLPQITALAADATGSRMRVQFAAAAATHAPRAAVFELAWTVVNGDDETDHRWTVLTPPPAGDSISLPQIPAELATFAPVLPGNPGDYTPSLTLVDDTAFASFADLAASDWDAEIGGYAPTRPGLRTVTISSRP
jgi:hypothetical protein